MIPLNLSLSDASTLQANPAAGLLGGGFVFAPVRQLGGRGNRLDNTQSPSTSQTGPGTPASIAAPLGLVSGSTSYLLPAALLGGAVILTAVLLRRK